MGTVGVSKLSAVGNVYNLKSAADLAGTYMAGAVGVAIAGGVKGTLAGNAKGVVIDLKSSQAGGRGRPGRCALRHIGAQGGFRG